MRVASCVFPAVLLFAVPSNELAQTKSYACEPSVELGQWFASLTTSRERLKLLEMRLTGDSDNLFLNRWYLESPGLPAGSRSTEYEARLKQHPTDPIYIYPLPSG
jgi:hypothetical protein